MGSISTSKGAQAPGKGKDMAQKVDYEYMYERWEYLLTDEEKKNETKDTIKDFFETMRWMAEGTGTEEENLTDEQIDNIVDYIIERNKA